MSEFEKCLKERRIQRIDVSGELVKKEMDAAEYDLERAGRNVEEEDFKWASVQAYYSMFHAAKALLFSKGYREKSHYCLIAAIRELFVATGEMSAGVADNLEMCMDIRHEADYGLVYDEASSRQAVERAKGFLAAAKSVLSRRK
jgi:uncharacterized protein (UPF0332 family)